MKRSIPISDTRFDHLPFDAIRLICVHMEMKDVVSLYLVMKRGAALRAVERSLRFKTFLQGDPPAAVAPMVRGT